jgi:hypothetical protein
MIKYKEGDTVQIQSKEWMSAQEKNEDGAIVLVGENTIVTDMFCYAGKQAKVLAVNVGAEGSVRYRLDIDSGKWWWTNGMFVLQHNELLSAKEAIIAMLKGETLYDGEGDLNYFNEDKGWFEFVAAGDINHGWSFEGHLSREPRKRERGMTEDEMCAWVYSDESLGWMVRSGSREWGFPRSFIYNLEKEFYQRARLLPDQSGIDEDTIQGFEVEE